MFLSKMKFLGATVNLVAVSQASKQIMEQHFTEIFDDALLLALDLDNFSVSPIFETLNGYGCWWYRRKFFCIYA